MSGDEREIRQEDLESERSILATLCGVDGPEHGEVVYYLQEDDFVQPVCRAIYAALRVLIQANTEVNAITLRDEIRKTGNKFESLETIVDVLASNEVGRPAVLAEILGRKRRSRELIRAATLALSRARMDGDPDALALELGAELSRITIAGSRISEGPWSTLLDRISEGKPFRANVNVERQGWWGITELDDLAWIPAGETCLIGARPKVGKTALGLQIAIESARRGMKPCVVSLELPRPAVESRLAAYLSGSTARAFKHGDYNTDHTSDLWAYKTLLDQGQLACPPQGTPWHKVSAYLRRQIDLGCNLAVLDYFSLIGRPSVRQNSSDAYAYAALSEAITAFAKETGIGLVLLAQLKQDAGGGTPTDKDFADSDRPYRDANIALFLWRNQQGVTMAKLDKNRDGVDGWTHAMDLVRGVRFLTLDQETNPESQPAAPKDKWRRA